MVLINTAKPQAEIRHVYLRRALAIKEELDRARAGDLPQPAQLEPTPAWAGTGESMIEPSR
jgi:hypothetical protein